MVNQEAQRWTMTNSAVVSVKNLQHSYGEKSVLKGLDFSLQAGRVYGF